MTHPHLTTTLRIVASLSLITPMMACNTDASTSPQSTPEATPTSAPSSHTPPPAATPAIAQYPSFADIVEDARPAVINIFTRSKKVSKSNNPLFPHVPHERVRESLGSGFIIDASGLALTNHHVVANATDIEVRLLDERRFKATIIGQDPRTDTALIKIEASEELPTLKLADSDKLRVGEWVIAIGNPLGLTSTVTAGITSATGRTHVPLGGDLLYQDFIQTDASINPGNSGGPLIDIHGEVVGINTAISAEAQGIGFAIPINMVKELLPQLKQGKVKRSWLGLFIDDIPRQLSVQLSLPSNQGALVRKVVKGGPAERAKLQAGDILLKIDKELIKDANHLSWLAGHKEVGKTIDIELQRGNQRMMTRLRLGALPE